MITISSNQIKICSKCKQELPATIEFFHRNRKNKDGLRCMCKECGRAWHQQYYQKNKERIKNDRKNTRKHRYNYLKKYREKNKDKFKRYKQKRFNQDPDFWRAYSALHARIRRLKPKPLYCTICNRPNVKINLANISGEYKEDINDYIWLCHQCHYLFDLIRKTHESVSRNE